MPTNAYGKIGTYDSADGGLRILGITVNPGASGIDMNGIIADTTPTEPTFVIRGSKKSGTTVQDLGASETILDVVNNNDSSTPALRVSGNGNVTSGGIFIGSSGFAVPGNAFNVDDTGVMAVQGLQVNGYLSNIGQETFDQANIASATNLDTSVTQKRVYHVTGNTQIDCIIPNSGNTFVTLIFDSNPVVRNNQTCTGGNMALKLSGSANYSTAVGSVLTLWNDNQSVFREVSRTNL